VSSVRSTAKRPWMVIFSARRGLEIEFGTVSAVLRADKGIVRSMSPSYMLVLETEYVEVSYVDFEGENVWKERKT